MGSKRQRSDGGSGARQGGRRPVDALAMGRFVEALSRGETMAAAAREAGFDRSTYYELRKRDGEFAGMCDEALTRSSGPRFVHGGAKRKLQLRRNRRMRFTEERQDIFLSHFAGTCNLTEAAAKAGVSESTVDSHRRKDPRFARRFQEALDQSYGRLEADLIARRLEAQRRLREIEPSGEPEAEFERALKLLQRWDRRGGRLDLRRVGRGRERRWNFEEAVALLERKLRNMGIPIEPLPPGCERPDGALRLPPPGPPDGREEGGEDGEDEA
jgi:hypothetical protein